MEEITSQLSLLKTVNDVKDSLTPLVKPQLKLKILFHNYLKVTGDQALQLTVEPWKSVMLSCWKLDQTTEPQTTVQSLCMEYISLLWSQQTLGQTQTDCLAPNVDLRVSGTAATQPFGGSDTQHPLPSAREVDPEATEQQVILSIYSAQYFNVIVRKWQKTLRS